MRIFAEGGAFGAQRGPLSTAAGRRAGNLNKRKVRQHFSTLLSRVRTEFGRVWAGSGAAEQGREGQAKSGAFVPAHGWVWAYVEFFLKVPISVWFFFRKLF